MPVRAFGRLPHRVLEFLQALLTRQAQPAAKVVPQEIEVLGTGVHSRRSPIADDVSAGGKQIERRVHFVNQRVPSSSSHSLFECRQHAIRPDTRVRPVSNREGLSGGGSRERHCHRLVVLFPLFGHHASIFLHPFAPPALPGFLATMGALTPVRSALRTLIRGNEHRPCTRTGLLVSCIKPSDRSASNHLMPPPGFCLVLPRSLPRGLPTASLSRDPSVTWASPFAGRLATTTGRIEFVILRTSRSPPVALHPLSRGRSYFRLRGSDPTSTRTCTLLIRYTHKRPSPPPGPRPAQPPGSLWAGPAKRR
jgi:hypothetical protein